MSVTVTIRLSGDLDNRANRNVAEELIAAMETILAKAGCPAHAQEQRSEIRRFLGSDPYRTGGYDVELFTSYHAEE